MAAEVTVRRRLAVDRPAQLQRVDAGYLHERMRLGGVVGRDQAVLDPQRAQRGRRLQQQLLTVHDDAYRSATVSGRAGDVAEGVGVGDGEDVGEALELGVGEGDVVGLDVAEGVGVGDGLT